MPTTDLRQADLTPAHAELQKLAINGCLAQNSEPFKSFPHPDGWTAEPKYDGWRIVAIVGDGHVDFYARSGNSYNGKLPKVEAELLALPVGTIIDGEVVALRIEGDKVINEWNTAQHVMTKGSPSLAADKITFMAFDLIAHAGIDARALPYGKRRALLERVFETHPEFEAVALTIQVEPDQDTFEFMLMQGFEGMILKRVNAPYTSGGKNGAGWMKVKGVNTVEVVVIGFKPGKDGFEGMIGAVEFGQYMACGDCNPHTPGEYDNGTTCRRCLGMGKVLTPRGRCSGMDMRTRLDMTHNPDKWIGTVIEIAHMGVNIGKVDTGSFRHPQFKRRRPDKAATQVEWHDA